MLSRLQKPPREANFQFTPPAASIPFPRHVSPPLSPSLSGSPPPPPFSSARLPAPHASARRGSGGGLRPTSRGCSSVSAPSKSSSSSSAPPSAPPAGRGPRLLPRALRRAPPPRQPRQPPAPREPERRSASPSSAWIRRAAAYRPRLLVGERALGLLLPRRLPAGRGPCCTRIQGRCKTGRKKLNGMSSAPPATTSASPPPRPTLMSPGVEWNCRPSLTYRRPQVHCRLLQAAKFGHKFWFQCSDTEI